MYVILPPSSRISEGFKYNGSLLESLIAYSRARPLSDVAVFNDSSEGPPSLLSLSLLFYIEKDQFKSLVKKYNKK